jgi:hypothetical protein
LITILVIAVYPAHRRQQHILVEEALQFVGVAASVRVVKSLSLYHQIHLETNSEFWGEADLHGAAVWLLVLERSRDAVTMLHQINSLIGSLAVTHNSRSTCGQRSISDLVASSIGKLYNGFAVSLVFTLLNITLYNVK